VKSYGNIGQKGKSNSDKIWTIWKKGKLNSEMIWITIKLAFLPYFPYLFTIFFCILPIFSLFFFHIFTEENSEKIWKIQKKIVKGYGKYESKAS
jgi:hypothetical protein